MKYLILLAGYTCEVIAFVLAIAKRRYWRAAIWLVFAVAMVVVGVIWGIQDGIPK